MKTMKKVASIALALVLMLALCVPAMAAEAHTITVEGAYPGNTYNAYKIFDLESYADGVQSYKIAAGWAGLFTGDFADYVKELDGGYVSWNGPATGSSDLADFAKAALAYAKENSIAPAGTVESSERTDANYATPENVVISVATLGWYLVDSSNGALCSLDVTTPNATVAEKNPAPSIVKHSDNENNTKKIGDTVNFTITVTAQKGAEAYVVHDKMGSGLTLNAASVIASSGEGSYTVKTSGLTDGCTFEVEFTKVYLDTITAETTITITYSAMINENAVTESIGNKTQLKYGDNEHTPWSQVGGDPEDPDPTPEVYNINVVKVDGDSNETITGAEFELYADEAGTQKIALTKVIETKTVEGEDGEEVTVTETYYRPALAGETEAVVEAGTAVIKGLGNGTYYLKETQAPAGYNALTDLKAATITNGAVATATVENFTGAVLPSTGGIGTTIFYVGGGLLVLAAAVLLITKKRMGAAG